MGRLPGIQRSVVLWMGPGLMNVFESGMNCL